MPTFDVLLKPFEGPTDAEKRAFAIRLNVLESILRAPAKMLPGYGQWFPLHPVRNVVVNEHGGDFDIRFEGAGEANLLVLDAGSDVVAIGGAVDASYKLKIYGVTNTTGSIEIGGGFIANLVTKTANYTSTANNYTILCNATSGSFTITLPAAASHTGKMYHIKKIDSSGNVVTVDGNSSETIDDATTAVLTVQYESITIQSDGSEWWIL